MKSREDAVKVARNCRALKVRGRQVWLWCHHLQQQTVGLQLDEGALTAYCELDGVPEQWVDSMIHASNQAEADQLLKSMQQTRAGPASDRLTDTLRLECTDQVKLSMLY